MPPPQSAPATVLTLAGVAALKGCSTHQVRHAIRSNVLPASKIGRSYVVLEADAAAWPGPPAPGASLDAYWRARGKRKAEAGSAPTYAPALVRMRDDGLTPAEVIVSEAGLPDAVVDFGLFRAALRTVAGLPSKAGGAFLYDELDASGATG